jgi:hypothetical protein
VREPDDDIHALCPSRELLVQKDSFKTMIYMHMLKKVGGL